MMGHRRRAGRLAVFLLAAACGAALAVAGAPSAQAATTTYYVAATGCSDANPGTSPSQPFCTLIKAASVATGPGITVQVASGSYTGVNIGGSGAAGSPLTFTAAPGASVIVSNSANGFSISGRSWVVINGFTVSGTTGFGISVRNSSNVTISNNTVTYSGTPQQGSIAAGIYLTGVTGSTVAGNHADDNSDSGIYLTGGTTGTTVSGNEASFNAQQWQRNANGINVISPGNTIIRNILHDNEDSGIQFYPGGNDNLATLNVSYGNGDHGIDDLNVTGGRIIGNTIYRNCTTGINVEGTSGNYVVENNVSVDNAVFVVNPTPMNGYTNTCNRRHGNIGIWDSAPPTTTVDHNLVNLTVSGTMYAWNGTSYTTLAAMKTASGQERYGMQADPRWVSVPAANFQLQGTSPAIDQANSAVSGEQSTDIVGAPRVDVVGVANSPDGGTRPYDDLGAYEYQPGSQVLPPTAALTVTPTSGTAPLAVTANASGSSDPQGQTLSYSFDFGDGTVVGPQAGSTATHTYTGPGSYTVKVTVTNTSGLSAHATGAVTASSSVNPPTAALTVTPTSGTAPLAVTANASASSDPQGQTLSYSFDFGDGTVVGPQAGSTATHTYAAAGSYAAKVTVTNVSGLSASATATVTATAAAAPGYVSQIATNYSLSAHTSGTITVWRTGGVAAGDTAVVTVQLTGTAATGAVAGTDARGNSYTVASDVADTFGNRLIVLSGRITTTLAVNDKITVTFPSAASYRITGDELSNVTGVDRTSTSTGSGTTFTTGPSGTTSSAHEVVFAAVALDGGTSPTWAAGWTALTPYQATGTTTVLGRAYQLSSSTGSFTAGGTGSGHWLAALATFS
jgi:parallel beta-helix repeat protein